MIIIYFGHRFPQTSHIRGHLLSTQMALLHPSADTSYVGTQRTLMDWRFPKHYRWAWHEIHSLSNQLSILPLYMLISICDYLHSNSRTYATISKASHVLYTSIFIATRIHICTRVSFIETRVSYADCQYQYSHTHPFDIKNNKTRLMEIYWALIINYLNCFNLLNCFIS